MKNKKMTYRVKRESVLSEMSFIEAVENQCPFSAEETLPVLLLHKLQSMLGQLKLNRAGCSVRRELMGRIVREYLQYRDCYIAVFENKLRDSLETVSELRENFEKVIREIEAFISSNPDISVAD